MFVGENLNKRDKSNSRSRNQKVAKLLRYLKEGATVELIKFGTVKNGIAATLLYIQQPLANTLYPNSGLGWKIVETKTKESIQLKSNEWTEGLPFKIFFCAGGNLVLVSPKDGCKVMRFKMLTYFNSVCLGRQ